MAIQAREMILCVVLFASSVLLFYGVKSRTPQQLNVNMTATHSKHRTEEVFILAITLNLVIYCSTYVYII